MGFGKSCSEEAIIDECKVLVDNIKENIREIEDEIYLDKNLNCAALNIIWNLVAGQRFLYDDQKMKDLVKFVGKYAKKRFFKISKSKLTILNISNNLLNSYIEFSG